MTVDLARRAGNGTTDVDDFASSYRSTVGQVTALFRAKGVPAEEANDLAHETILRTLVHLKRHGRERTDLGPLVRTIARNLLVERVRKHAPQMVALTDEIDVASHEDGPAELLEADERRDAVRRAVAGLSPRHRHAVKMWMDGKTPAEIARELGIKRNAVDAILHRARRSLAAKLDGNGVFGLFGLAALRARVFGRRIAEMFSNIDPSGQLAAASGGLAIVAAAAVIAAGPVSNGTPAVNTGRISDRVGTSVSNLHGATGQDADAIPTLSSTRSAGASATRPHAEISTDLRNEAVSANVITEDPNTGKPQKLGIDTWQQRDQSHPGVIGPMLDSLTAATCSPMVCGGKR